VDRPGALTIQQYPDPVGRLRGWARAFVGGNPTDTLALLKDLSAGVSGWIRYQSREDEAPSRRPRLWIAAGDPAGILRSSLLKRRAVSVSSKGRRLPDPRGFPQTLNLICFGGSP
jgi:hypothetical protein